MDNFLVPYSLFIFTQMMYMVLKIRMNMMIMNLFIHAHRHVWITFLQRCMPLHSDEDEVKDDESE